jgi:PAS domain S-box-containing protein
MIAEFQYLRIADCTRFLESFNTATDIPALITITEKTLEEILPFEYSGLYLFDEQSQQLKLFVARGLSKKEQEVAESTAMQRHPGTVYKTGKAIYVPDVTQDKNKITTDSPRSFTVKSRLYLPIRSNGKVIGTFGVVSAKPHAFNQAEQELFEFICTLAGSVHFRIITENKRKIYEAESNKLSAIVKYTDNAVVVTDPEGKIEWINESFTKMTGYTLDECIGKIPGHFLQGASSNFEVREKIRQALIRKEKIDVTIVNYTKDGSPYDVFLQISPIFDEKGQHTHFVAIQRA